MIKVYFKYLTQSTNQHGVHSPFVYNLVTKCIYKSSDKLFLKAFHQFKQNNIQANKTILVNDFGAGSKRNSTAQRTIKEIVKNVSVNKKYASLLNRLIAYFQVEHVLELGTSIGTSAFSMVYNNNKVHITTIEGCEQIHLIAQQNFEKWKITSQTEAHLGTFNATLPLFHQRKFDMIFFDGDHQENSTIQYFEKCLKNIHNDTLFVFDDIHWSQSMEKAWSYIVNHPQVTVSIDLFQFGLVSFRKEQVKQHFIIRY